MLLTTQNIGAIVGANSLENAFIGWVAMQAQADSETFIIRNGYSASIGNVSYQLLSNGVIRGRCPEIGVFVAATIN